MNKIVMVLLTTLTIIFILPSTAIAGLPLKEHVPVIIEKNKKIINQSLKLSDVNIKLLTYKPLVIEKRDLIFEGWKNLINNHKKKSSK